MNTIMALNRKELERVMEANEREIIELYDENKKLRLKIKQLEDDCRHYNERITILENIKVEERASKGVWKTIAAATAAFGALIAALFFKKDE
jgi:phage shock protein A